MCHREGVTDQLCWSHVSFHFQMVCQMESCQQLERAATLPAYKHQCSSPQKLAVEFSRLASSKMKA